MSFLGSYGEPYNNEFIQEGVDDFVVSENTINEINEQMLVSECLTFNEAQLDAFLESDLCKTLVQEGKMRKNTLVLLGKNADVDRRFTLICLNLAKANNDPDWEKLRKNRVIERKLLGRIKKKWGSKARKLSKIQQKDWIKNRMPANFGKFGGADRI